MDEPSPGTPGQEPLGLTRAGISRASADALRNLNLRFDDCYLIRFMDGPRGTRWYAMPKDAPDQDITAESAARLAEILVLDHDARQEARRKNMTARAGCENADRMST